MWSERHDDDCKLCGGRNRSVEYRYVLVVSAATERAGKRDSCYFYHRHEDAVQEEGKGRDRKEESRGGAENGLKRRRGLGTKNGGSHGADTLRSCVETCRICIRSCAMSQDTLCRIRTYVLLPPSQFAVLPMN